MIFGVPVPAPIPAPVTATALALALSLAVSTTVVITTAVVSKPAHASAWEDAPPALKLKTSPRLQEQFSQELRRQLPIYLESGTLSGNASTHLELGGGARVRRGDVAISAQEAHYDTLEDRLDAQGDVRINQAGNVYEGVQLQMQLSTFTGEFSEARYKFLQTSGHGQAERVEFHDRQRSTVYSANYTTCQIDDEETWQPAWQLRAKRIELDRETDTGVAYGGVLEFKGVALLPVPAVSFPLSDKRKSGLLPPTIGIDSVSGLEYAQPYYWNIAPNYDATITPMLMSRRGVNLGAEFRYLRPDYEGEIELNYMPDDRLRGQKRWSYAWEHALDLSSITPNLSASWNLHRVSDNDYWRDFSLHRYRNMLNERLLESHGELRWNSNDSGHSLLLRAQQWQVLQDVQAPIIAPFDRLPQLQWRYEPPALHSNPLGLDWRLEADTTRFRARTLYGADHPDNGQRSYALAQVSRPFLSAAGFITPKFQLHAAHYKKENSTTNRPNFSSVLPTFSLDSGLILERPTQWRSAQLVQTLEPRLFYTYTPYRDQMNQPLYDTALSDFNLTSIYTENSYVGHDRIADNHTLTMGLSTRYLRADTGAELMRFGLAQRLRFSDQRTSLGYDAPGRKGSSDLLLGAGLSLSQRWRMDALVQYNRDIQRTTRSTISGRYSPGKHRVVSAAYRYQRENSAPIANQGSENVDIAWQWPLRLKVNEGSGSNVNQGGWYSVGRVNYSMQDRKLVEGVLGLEYDGCCWISRVVLERLQSGLSRANTRLLFQLEFVGFSRLSLGTNPLGRLQEHIPGYEPLRSGEQYEPVSRFRAYD